MNRHVLLLVVWAVFLEAQPPPSLTPIHDAILRAKRNGLTAMTVPAGEEIGLAFRSADVALRSSLVVEATLIEKVPTYSLNPIESMSTYLHFAVTRRLNTGSAPTGEMPPHVPLRLRNVDANNLVVQIYDKGQMVIDGILVTNGNDLSDFVIGHNYFMFLQFNGTQMATLPYGGSASSWEINGDELLPLRPHHDAAMALERQGLRTLTAVEHYLKSITLRKQ